jgi:hypothetical protein
MAPEVTVAITLGQAEEFKVDPKVPKPRLLVMPSLDLGILWGFFDGAAQGHPSKCSVGVVLFIIQTHYIHIRYAPRRGTNNKDEMIALWTLLETTKQKKS